ELCNQRSCHRTCSHDYGSVSRARAFEHIAHIGEPVLQRPREIGMSGPRQCDLLGSLARRLTLRRPGAHPPLPVLVIPIAHDERKRSPERASMAQAGEHLDRVLLDLLAWTTAIALLAPVQVGVDRRLVEDEA